MSDTPRGARETFSVIDEAKRAAEYDELRRNGLSDAEARGTVWPNQIHERDVAGITNDARLMGERPKTRHRLPFPWVYALWFVAGATVVAALMCIPLNAANQRADKAEDAVVKLEQIVDDCAAAAEAWESSASALRASGTIMGGVASELLTGSFWTTDYSGIADTIDTATAKVDEANAHEADAPNCDR